MTYLDAHWAGAGFGFWWIFPLFFASLWLLFLGLLVWRFAWGPRRHGQGWAGPGATAVLRERFARGEIDADEYERRRRVLEADR